MAVGAAVWGGSAQEAGAAFLNVNVPGSSIFGATPAFTARYKFDMGGGVDQMLYKQPDPTGYPASDLIRMSAVNGQYQGSATYRFTLTHIAANGGGSNGASAKSQFFFTLDQGAVSGQSSFASPASTSNTLTWSPAVGDLNYNILHLYASAQNGSTVSISDLALTTDTSLEQVGDLQTAASVTGGTYDQWLAADIATNLDSSTWTLSGLVKLQVNGPRANNEALKFEVSGKQGALLIPQVVPEPGAAMGGMGMSLVTLARKARRH
jgi:hypothetical protein